MSDAILQHVGDRIWLAEGDLINFYSFAYPTRMVIAKLAQGGLWVWSPVSLTEERKRAIDRLGEVAHLVSPNKIHHLYLNDWLSAYPKARLWGPQSTISKRPDLRFEAALGDTPPAEWSNEIDQAWLKGSFLLDEIAFFHRPSCTAILADSSENFSDEFLSRHWSWWQRPIARLWKITVGYGYAPLELRLSTLDRRDARRAVAKVLAWDPMKVVMAHGEWQPSEGRAYLEQAFAWLGPHR